MSKVTRRWELRRRMWEEQGQRCYWCGEVCELPTPGSVVQHPRTATFDHLVPKSLGGHYVDDNGVMACNCCNTRRGNRPVDPVTQVRFDPYSLLSLRPRSAIADGTPPVIVPTPARKKKGPKRKCSAWAVGRSMQVREMIKLLRTLPQDQDVRFGTPHGEFKVVIGMSGTTGLDHTRIEVG